MNFAGPSDQNIKFIETKFKSTIVLRGNELLVNGSKEEVQILQRLVSDMVNSIIRKDNISTSDIKILLQSQSKDININIKLEPKHNRICFNNAVNPE